MPGKIHSSKQFRFLEGIAHGMKTDKGPSKKIAKRMLEDEEESPKKRFKKKK